MMRGALQKLQERSRQRKKLRAAANNEERIKKLQSFGIAPESVEQEVYDCLKDIITHVIKIDNFEEFEWDYPRYSSDKSPLKHTKLKLVNTFCV